MRKENETRTQCGLSFEIPHERKKKKVELSSRIDGENIWIVAYYSKFRE